MKRRLIFTIAVFCALCVTAVGLLAGLAPAPDPKFTLLQNFEGAPGSGRGPMSQQLATDGSKLYGMTVSGGANDSGALYSVNIDGTGFALLHSFDGSDGSQPQGSLLLSGGTLYGMAMFGGISGRGALFSINTDGTNFLVLHEFAGGAGDGQWPYGSLIMNGGKLYGTTWGGGTYNKGLIFSIDPNGNNFAVPYSFGQDDANGTYPTGSLIASAGKFYGMTNQGGANFRGVIFSVNTDGTGYSVIHQFSSGVGDGSYPQGDLLLTGGKLYGMTGGGGLTTMGVIFSMNTDGSNFALMHEFAGSPADGDYPAGALVLHNGKFYGTTSTGGSLNVGVLFSIDTDGTDYTVLYHFTGAANGANPGKEAPVISGSYLYGATTAGGSSGFGAIYRYEVGAATPPAPVVPGCFINTVI